MMGNDAERIVAEIEAVKDAASAGIVSLSSATAYQLTCIPLETEVPDGNPMAAVSAAMSAASGDFGKTESLGGELYVGTTSYNNSVGSPWTELGKLKKAVADAEAYSGAHAPFNYVGEKAGMLALLNMVMTAAVDTKWAFVVYHDYIQRGFDNKFNSNKPSVTFSGGSGETTTGNVVQEYGENVHITQPPLDPF